MVEEQVGREGTKTNHNRMEKKRGVRRKNGTYRRKLKCGGQEYNFAEKQKAKNLKHLYIDLLQDGHVTREKRIEKR